MKYVISEIITHNAAVKEIRLRDPEAKALPAWPPGAHLQLCLTGRDGQTHERHYSLVGPPAASSDYRIAVLRLDNSTGGSRCLHEELEAGMLVDVAGPYDSFPLAPVASTTRVMLIAGGIGITPLVSMAHALGARGVPFTLHYLAHSVQRLILLDELQAIPHMQLVMHLSQQAGRADLEVLLGYYDGAVELYACGPVPLLQALRQSGNRLGWPDNAMHFESFGARPAASDAPLCVELAMSQLQITVQPGTSILDALIAADVFVSYECKRGECANCYTHVVSGDPVHRDVCLTPAQRAVGMCTCVSWVASGRLVLDL
ncbi:PDR/VanB family oxidoreductase [Rugamonas sp.]|uniref:PDR/VanB family oxidoreductase n=1 Tax=Rugamonas sp. TaxID=1926287 RepID=UPI0025E3ACB5|nr:PDR/VanB family oxidoreductase [Rugamonas sp.]